jgi:hypothetical protein
MRCAWPQAVSRSRRSASACPPFAFAGARAGRAQRARLRQAMGAACLPCAPESRRGRQLFVHSCARALTQRVALVGVQRLAMPGGKPVVATLERGQNINRRDILKGSSALLARPQPAYRRQSQGRGLRQRVALRGQERVGSPATRGAAAGAARGGLAFHVMVPTGAAVSGSSPATVVAIGSILVRHEFPNGFGTGVITTSGSLGILIPLSIPMVIYAVATNSSVGKLCIAGMVPGLMLATLLGLRPGVTHARTLLRACPRRAGARVLKPPRCLLGLLRIASGGHERRLRFIHRRLL